MKCEVYSGVAYSGVTAVPVVGDPGDPGVLFLSLAGELAPVLSPDLRREFWRERPVPI